MEKNLYGHDRGLHIVVFNPNNGIVETARVFDTHMNGDQFDRFILKDIPNGHILVAACKDDMFGKFSEEAKLWFENLGSKEIREVNYRMGFAFIAVIGEKMDMQERRAKMYENEV